MAKKLVPLMPILVRLGACEAACRFVREKNHATFAELWADNSNQNADEWRVWIGRQMYYRGFHKKMVGFCTDCACKDCHREIAEGARVEMPNGRDIERALYDYAVREGLA